MKWPKISIVTPSYNQGLYLEQTILSVIRQDYPNLEYIIIDGGSTDNSVEIIKKYDKHFKYWISEKDSGQADAINKGIKYASGEIFNWINSDDYLIDDSLLRIAEYFEENDNIDVLCGQEFRIDKNGNTLFTHPGSTIHEHLEDTLYAAHNVQPNTFFRLSVIRKLGGINNNYNYLMDAEIWAKYLMAFGQNNVLKVPDVFACFRIHEDSKTSTKYNDFMNERAILTFSIAKHLNVPKYLNYYLLKNNDLDQNKFSQNFLNGLTIYSRLNKMKFFSNIMSKYFIDLYHDGNYIESLSSLIYSLWYRKIKINKRYFFLLLKLLFIPKILLKSIHETKKV